MLKPFPFMAAMPTHQFKNLKTSEVLGGKFNYLFSKRYSQEIGMVMGYADYLATGYNFPIYTNLVSIRTNAVFILFNNQRTVLSGGPGLDFNFFIPTADGIEGKKMGLDVIITLGERNLFHTPLGIFITFRPQVMPFTSSINDANAPFNAQKISLVEVNAGISYQFRKRKTKS
jgi:hypothetical protein